MIDYGLIKSPLITEKGTLVSEQANQVVFRVRPDATKGAIRYAVQELFKVTVLKVRTINLMGKQRRVGRTSGKRPDWKKAYVTLKEGDRIEFFEGV
ncbi:MAG TPA: 50S ribosomal protein L23 [Candidatus Binataceae bacterium]|jgi:large subunit ribosomal protein L23|nr:50S ribosomal protein L23 [Candidatus Binataceae bacterium]HZY58221.1 50S ribosomal protein L23 [Candidatus Binataceae bacterium]